MASACWANFRAISEDCFFSQIVPSPLVAIILCAPPRSGRSSHHFGQTVHVHLKVVLGLNVSNSHTPYAVEYIHIIRWGECDPILVQFGSLLALAFPTLLHGAGRSGISGISAQT